MNHRNRVSEARERFGRWPTEAEILAASPSRRIAGWGVGRSAVLRGCGHTVDAVGHAQRSVRCRACGLLELERRHKRNRAIAREQVEHEMAAGAAGGDANGQ